MCNFNKQYEETKALIHLLMENCAQTIGGTNFLLGLVEALREQKPHPLITNKCEIKSQNVVIKWNKVVFKDKLMVLEEILLQRKSSQGSEFNILADLSDKKRKKVINMVRTLAPIEFLVTPIDKENGGGFDFKVFEKIEDDYIKINPLFTALFFCSTDFTKRALKYEMV